MELLRNNKTPLHCVDFLWPTNFLASRTKLDYFSFGIVSIPLTYRLLIFLLFIEIKIAFHGRLGSCNEVIQRKRNKIRQPFYRLMSFCRDMHSCIERLPKQMSKFGQLQHLDFRQKSYANILDILPLSLTSLKWEGLMFEYSDVNLAYLTNLQNLTLVESLGRLTPPKSPLISISLTKAQLFWFTWRTWKG